MSNLRDILTNKRIALFVEAVASCVAGHRTQAGSFMALSNVKDQDLLGLVLNIGLGGKLHSTPTPTATFATGADPYVLVGEGIRLLEDGPYPQTLWAQLPYHVQRLLGFMTLSGLFLTKRTALSLVQDPTPYDEIIAELAPRTGDSPYCEASTCPLCHSITKDAVCKSCNQLLARCVESRIHTFAVKLSYDTVPKFYRFKGTPSPFVVRYLDWQIRHDSDYIITFNRVSTTTKVYQPVLPFVEYRNIEDFSEV